MNNELNNEKPIESAAQKVELVRYIKKSHEMNWSEVVLYIPNKSDMLLMAEFPPYGRCTDFRVLEGAEHDEKIIEAKGIYALLQYVNGNKEKYSELPPGFKTKLDKFPWRLNLLDAATEYTDFHSLSLSSYPYEEIQTLLNAVADFGKINPILEKYFALADDEKAEL